MRVKERTACSGKYRGAALVSKSSDRPEPPTVVNMLNLAHSSLNAKAASHMNTRNARPRDVTDQGAHRHWIR